MHGDSNEPNGRIDRLISAMEGLKDSIDDFKDHSRNTVHIRLVVYMFLTLIISIAGIKGTEFFFGTYLPKVLAQSNEKPQ